MKGSSKQRKFVPSLIAVGVASLVVLPITWLATSLWQSSDGTWQHLYETVLADYLINTLLLALGVAGGTLLIGVPTAWLVTTYQFRGSRHFRWVLLLPLAIPSYLLAYAATDALQFSGPCQTWLRETFDWSRGDYWFPDVRTLPGAISILSLCLYPYVYLATRTALMEQSVCVLEAAKMLGAGPTRVLFCVALPLARPSIVAGLALAMMETLSDFGAVDYCAVDTLATGIYRTWFSRGSLVAAAQLSLCLLAIVTLVLIVESFARGSAKFHQSTSRRREIRQQPLRGWRSAFAMIICAAPVLLGFAIPVGVFVRMTWLAGDTRATELMWSLGRHSVTLASLSAVIAVVLATLLAYSRRSCSSLVVKFANRIVGVGYAIPGGVIAIGVMGAAWSVEDFSNDALASISDWSPGLFISGTIIAVLLGYQTRFLSVSISVITAGLTRIRPSLDYAAASLGSSTPKTLLLIHTPLLRSSLFCAALLVFVDVLKELPATLILRPFNYDTLAVRVYHLASDERLPEASTAALAIIATGLI
ncbi:MAG: iron ABC transporter permease, partial [Planctomycetota bacterium]